MQDNMRLSRDTYPKDPMVEQAMVLGAPSIL